MRQVTTQTTRNKIQEVVAIIDRSGSMSGKEADTIGGINSAFEVLREEKEANTDIKVSVKLFDHEEFLLIRSLDLANVRPIERAQYRPRGQTALLDAIGNTLTHFMEKKLANPSAYDSCIIYIVTDGLENASTHYDHRKIKKIIETADEKYNIKLLYLAANQDAILEAAKYGIASTQALNYSENTENVTSAYRSAARLANTYSTSRRAEFTNAERDSSLARTD